MQLHPHVLWVFSMLPARVLTPITTPANLMGTLIRDLLLVLTLSGLCCVCGDVLQFKHLSCRAVNCHTHCLPLVVCVHRCVRPSLLSARP